MGVFGAVCSRRGDAGFSGPLLGVSSGVVGFNVTLLSRLVREKDRPAWPDGGREREKVRPARPKHPKIGVLRLLGEFFRGNVAGGAVLGEFFRGNVAGGPCWASFFAEVPLEGPCWASLRTGSRGIPRGELCCAAALVVSPSTGSVNPSIRSYSHLVVAGRGRPPPPPTTLPATQSVDKGKVPSGQGRDKP